eukprot:4554717-Pyramimonas_sp.AAC.1
MFVFGIEEAERQKHPFLPFSFSPGLRSARRDKREHLRISTDYTRRRVYRAITVQGVASESETNGYRYPDFPIPGFPETERTRTRADRATATGTRPCEGSAEMGRNVNGFLPRNKTD